MKFKTLASGSKGNCSILISGNTKIIIDIGINYKQLLEMLRELNLDISSFSALLITHEHSDHIKGLKAFSKNNNIPIYIKEEMMIALESVIQHQDIIYIDDNVKIGNLNIDIINTSHDAIFPVGFLINNATKSMVYITDTGYINRKYISKLANKDLYLIESNHDEKMVMEGKYPYFLKQRVLSDIGHLSNNMTASYLKKMIGPLTKNIVLAHISQENNTYELAYSTISERISNSNIKITVAKQEEQSKYFEV